MQYVNEPIRRPIEQKYMPRSANDYCTNSNAEQNNKTKKSYKATTTSHAVCAFCNIKTEMHDYGVCYSCYSLDRMVCVCCKGAFKDISKSGLQADGLCKECTKEALDINCGRYTRFNKYKTS